jgi:aryl sulfotransferase
MQMLCALLIFDTAEFHRPLTEISPWLDAATYDTAATIAELEAQRHRRFIKTHTPLDGLPFHPEVTYLCVGRDPREAMLSFEQAMANVDPAAMVESGLDPQASQPPSEDPLERFWLWADADLTTEPTSFGSTLANTVNHARTFWERRDEPQIALFHYADLKADLLGQLARLATVLSIEKEQAADRGPRRRRDLRTHAAPGRRVGPGHRRQTVAQQLRLLPVRQQRQMARPARLRRRRPLPKRVAELAPPNLIAWLHTGSAGVPAT